MSPQILAVVTEFTFDAVPGLAHAAGGCEHLERWAVLGACEGGQRWPPTADITHEGAASRALMVWLGQLDLGVQPYPGSPGVDGDRRAGVQGPEVDGRPGR
jgi:hypothetical protein